MFKNIFSVTKEQKENRKYLVFRILGLKFKKRIKRGAIYWINGENKIRLKNIKGLSVEFCGSDSVIEIVGNKVPGFGGAAPLAFGGFGFGQGHDLNRFGSRLGFLPAGQLGR